MELINYCGPGGDRIQDLQTEATPLAASCPARSLHATEIVSKTQFQWQARGCTGQLTTHLECTGVDFNNCVCVDFELHPGAGDIHTVKCRYNAVFGVQEIDRVIAVTAL